LFEIFFHLGLDILHEDQISEDMLLGCDHTALMPHDEESSMIEEDISEEHEKDSSYDECNSNMNHLRLVEGDIAHVIDELCSEDHREDIRGLFGEFCEYDKSFESGPNRPTCHE
jgi:hypothetical protein